MLKVFLSFTTGCNEEKYLLPTSDDGDGIDNQNNEMKELLNMVFFGRLPEGEDLTSAYQYGIRHGFDRLRAKYADNHGAFKVETIIFGSPEEFVLTKAIQCSPWKSLEKIKAEGCSLSKDDIGTGFHYLHNITAIAEATRKGVLPNLSCSTIGSQETMFISFALLRNLVMNSSESVHSERKQIMETSEVEITMHSMQPIQNATGIISSSAKHALHHEERLPKLKDVIAMVSTCYSFVTLHSVNSVYHQITQQTKTARLLIISPISSSLLFGKGINSESQKCDYHALRG